MSDITIPRSSIAIGPLLFRIALFAAAASLVVYIPYKYANTAHALTGLYAFLFPMSSILGLVGMALAIKPEASCSCNMVTRVGFGTFSALWIVTGIQCIPHLTEMIEKNALGGVIATAHMSIQHILLSLVIIAFAIAPYWMTLKLGRSGDLGKLGNESILA